MQIHKTPAELIYSGIRATNVGSRDGEINADLKDPLLRTWPGNLGSSPKHLGSRAPTGGEHC